MSSRAWNNKWYLSARSVLVFDMALLDNGVKLIPDSVTRHSVLLFCIQFAT